MVTRRQIQACAKEIGREFRPRRIILFGSYAFGNQNDSRSGRAAVCADESAHPGAAGALQGATEEKMKTWRDWPRMRFADTIRIEA